MASYLCNDDLANPVGQDKPAKEPINVYDQKMGKYEDKKPAIGDLKQAPSTVSPFGSLK
jgi:hypothetical protein